MNLLILIAKRTEWSFKCGLCTSLWILSLSIAVFSTSTFADSKNTALTIEKNHIETLTVSDSDAGMVVVDTSTGVFHFDDVDPLSYGDSGYTIWHDFVLINNNKDALVINAIRGSDPNAEYDLLLPAKQLPITVSPKDFVTIRICYHLIPLSPGNLDLSEVIFIDHQVQPAATLKFNGTIRKVVNFDPALLDFGTMKPRQVVSKVLTVTYDPQMYPSLMPLPVEKLPHVASDLPFITLKQIKISGTKISKIAEQLSANQNRLPNSKEHERRIRKHLNLLDTLPPLNNIVSYTVAVKAPNEPGAFNGFISILPVDGTTGAEVIKRVFMKVQGQVSR